MATKRHKPEEIVSKLRQVDVLVGQGQLRIDAIRQMQITEQTYYRWRKQYGGMGTDQLKELKRLRKENERLACVPPRGVRSAHGGVGHRERSDRSPRSPWVSLNEAAIACLR